MKRKEFIKRSAFVVAAGLPIATILQSCGDDDSADPEDEDMEPGSTANCLDNGTNVSIGANHGHSLVVSKDDVTAGAEKTYSIRGDSAHSHDVTLTAANFQSLQQNQAVTVNSNSGSGHTHSVSVTCA